MIIFVCCIALLLWSIYQLYDVYRVLVRNERVYAFLMTVVDMGSSYCRRHIMDDDALDVYEWFVNKWNYEDILYSRKPLTLEEWYTKEEIEKINS